MKNLALVLSTIVLLFMFSCGGGSSTSSEEKTGIYEPKTQDQFVSILDDMGVKPYPGAKISGFTHLTDATIRYIVPSAGNTNKAILEYYKKEFEQAFNEKEGWHLFADNALGVTYMKGFELTFSMTLTSKNAAREMAGDMEDVPKKLKFEISLGDGADSY